MKDELIRLGIDYNSLLTRLGNQEILIKKFLRKFLDDDTLDNIIINYEQQNFEKLLYYVHTLKGISGNLSMNILYHICDEWVAAIRANDHEKDEYNYIRCCREYNSIKSGLEIIFQGDLA